MSVEAPKVVEETPAPAKPLPTTEETTTTVPAAEATPAAATTTESAAVKPETEATPAAVTEEPLGDDKVVVEAKPADEGVLGYKAPGFLKQFHYSKHHFWFTYEPSTLESLAIFHRNEKNEITHSTTAWAQETGQGVLFFSKRVEDKSQPTGLILLADASNVTKEGANEFSFIVNKKSHRFEAKDSAERDSWVVAVEKNIEGAKALKEELTGRDSYKKAMENFGTTAAGTAAVSKPERSSSKGPKKSLDATTATAAATTEPITKPETSSISSSDKETKKADKAAKKERSQSRKRQSVFGIFGGKTAEEKEAEKAEKKAEKEAKEAEKAEKKAEAEQKKEEKKVEAEQKKEEAEATKEPSKATEAVEAAAVAAAPAAVVAAVEEKKEKKEEDATTSEATSPSEKKNKRASVFGFFGKKNVTSPSTEKTEKDATVVPTTEPVSETAPKLDEPIENKPIDTAAVTAPAETTVAPTVPATTPAVEESATESATTAAPTTETTTAPKTEKKGFLAGVFKKAESKKEEHKEEKAAEQIAKDPVVAAAPTEPAAETETPTETPAAATETPKEERAAREKRRTSFFGLGGSTKKKTETEGEVAADASEIKREKSPLPSKIGSLFRKNSKAVKPTTTEAPKETEVTTETPANATVPEPTESKIVGDVVPDELHTTVHDSVTVAPTEVKTSA